MSSSIEIYNISLPQFEGPFDLLLFFIERDEIDIYDIPIVKITSDFLEYIKLMEQMNIELASEFILFASILIRIKAKTLLPRKEIDVQGQEIDPREELVAKLVEYKKYKAAALAMQELEEERIQQQNRGNSRADLLEIAGQIDDNSDLEKLNTYKIAKAFEKVMRRFADEHLKPRHVVQKYDYTIEGQRSYVIDTLQKYKKVSFVSLFQTLENKVQAIFTFLALLEMVQQKICALHLGEGRNNFLVELQDNVDDIISNLSSSKGFLYNKSNHTA